MWSKFKLSVNTPQPFGWAHDEALLLEGRVKVPYIVRLIPRLRSEWCAERSRSVCEVEASRRSQEGVYLISTITLLFRASVEQSCRNTNLMWRKFKVEILRSFHFLRMTGMHWLSHSEKKNLIYLDIGYKWAWWNCRCSFHVMTIIRRNIVCTQLNL